MSIEARGLTKKEKRAKIGDDHSDWQTYWKIDKQMNGKKKARKIEK